LHIKAHSDGLIVLLIEGHASHITPRAVASAGSQRIALTRLVAHASRINQPLDFHIFSLFKILYNGTTNAQTEKNAEDISRHCVFDKATIIPMVRWSFLRAGFHLNPKNLLALLIVTRTEVLERIILPELSLEDVIFSAPDEAVRAAERPASRRAPIPGPIEFTISLKADVDTVAATCPKRNSSTCFLLLRIFL
jgi:hypothetical protein